jgi:hypothetical protein
LGIDYQFFKGTESLPHMVIYPTLEVPTGDASEGLGSGHLQFFLPVWAEQEIGKWTIYGGGGFELNPGGNNRDWVITGIVAQYQVLDNLALGAEVYNRTSQQVGQRDDTAFNLGATYDFNDTYHLVVSAGRSIRGPTQFQSYLALQLTF